MMDFCFRKRKRIISRKSNEIVSSQDRHTDESVSSIESCGIVRNIKMLILQSISCLEYFFSFPLDSYLIIYLLMYFYKFLLDIFMDQRISLMKLIITDMTRYPLIFIFR